MTRRKKSRKPGPLAPTQKPRDSDSANNTPQGKRKGKGHKPGLRHSQAHVKVTENPEKATDDPRKGSRRKVTLISSPVNQTSELSPADELKQLEQDEQLQLLLERFEQGDELSTTEQAYLDKKSERYEQLAEQLGIELDDDWDEEEF